MLKEVEQRREGDRKEDNHMSPLPTNSPLPPLCASTDTSRLASLLVGETSGGRLVGRRYFEEIGRPPVLLAITIPVQHRFVCVIEIENTVTSCPRMLKLGDQLDLQKAGL